MHVMKIRGVSEEFRNGADIQHVEYRRSAVLKAGLNRYPKAMKNVHDCALACLSQADDHDVSSGHVVICKKEIHCRYEEMGYR